ncbi:hypothetical protein K5I04_04310 [Murdochiella sp. Marseille-P8839]|nr:hypothetical protein [Murdochiella sp. Marseille-P8839]
MVVEMHFCLSATIDEDLSDGWGNAFSLNHHHPQGHKRWWGKRVFALLPPSPRSESMMGKAYFCLTTTIAEGINDGGGNAFSRNHHHFPRNKRLCP